MKIDWEEQLSIFSVGFVTVVILAAIGGIIWGALAGPKTFSIIVGIILGIYAVGWFHLAIGHAFEEWQRKRKNGTDQKEPPYKSKMDNTTLALLDELEAKYKMSTLTFIQLMLLQDMPVDPKDYIVFQQKWDNILGGISPLDTITWVGLVNSLPSMFNAVPEVPSK